MKKVALFGNVNTEEIIAHYLTREGVVVDGYLLFPNKAFEGKCRKSVILSEQKDGYIENELPNILKQENYDFILLGPEFMVGLMSEVLRKNKIGHIGATPKQIAFENDKSLIGKIFPNKTKVLPRRINIDEDNIEQLEEIIRNFDGQFVLKFVGNYSEKYGGSPVGRVRFSGETIKGMDEVIDFIKKSLSVSGKCIIEEKVAGKEFSSNYAVDSKGNFFRLGENICFKRRENGNTGPICDGAGSISYDNTLPFLNEEDIAYVENEILAPFIEYIIKETGEAPCTLLNLDLMKKNDGRIILFEVNVREAGGHTMANLLPGLETSLYEVLKKTQDGKLENMVPIYKKRTSIVVSAFPPYFPQGTTEEKLLVVEVTKDIPEDVNLFTGWVNVIEENDHYRKLKLRNSPVLLFEHSNKTMKAARKRIYKVLKEVVPNALDYRTDIGI